MNNPGDMTPPRGYCLNFPKEPASRLPGTTEEIPPENEALPGGEPGHTVPGQFSAKGDGR